MKRLLITQRLNRDEHSQELREALDVRWAPLLASVGLQAIPYPTLSNPQEFLSELHPDGIILSGGNDIAVCVDDEFSRLRDQCDGALLKEAIARRIPVLGVCRGMQFIAQYFGLSVKPVSDHVRVRHSLRVSAKSRYLAGCAPYEVNSYHTYAPHLAPDSPLKIAATAPDGVIEAIEHLSLPIGGILWHPEREESLQPFDREILVRLFLNG